MKKLLALVLALLLLTGIAYANPITKDEIKRENWQVGYVKRFDITAGYYLPMGGLDWEIESVEYTDLGYLGRTKMVAPYKESVMSFTAENGGGYTLEYTSDSEELNLAFAKALVVAVNGNYDLVDEINKLPQTGIPYSKNETVYACGIEHVKVVRYTVLKVTSKEYLHTITVL